MTMSQPCLECGRINTMRAAQARLCSERCQKVRDARRQAEARAASVSARNVEIRTQVVKREEGWVPSGPPRSTPDQIDAAIARAKAAQN